MEWLIVFTNKNVEKESGEKCGDMDEEGGKSDDFKKNAKKSVTKMWRNANFSILDFSAFI